MSQDMFQMRKDNITDVTRYHLVHDDICIFGKTQQEHDEILFQLMKKATRNDLVFNSNKCQISQPNILSMEPYSQCKG